MTHWKLSHSTLPPKLQFGREFKGNIRISRTWGLSPLFINIYHPHSVPVRKRALKLWSYCVATTFLTGFSVRSWIKVKVVNGFSRNWICWKNIKLWLAKGTPSEKANILFRFCLRSEEQSYSESHRTICLRLSDFAWDPQLKNQKQTPVWDQGKL